MNLDIDDDDNDDDGKEENEGKDENDDNDGDDNDDDDGKQENEGKDDNIFYVLAARFYKKNELFGCIGHINWQRYQWRLVQAASKLPKQWFEPNNELHEFIMWYDGTTFFNHHTTGVGLLCFIYRYSYIYFLYLKKKKYYYLSIDMLVGQFMETSTHILSKLTCYHPLAAFPKNAFQDDVQTIIKFS